MAKKLSAQPVRAVILRSAIGTIGGDDEMHTSLELQGLTAAWMPGDHGLCLIVGGGVLDGLQVEPAVTVIMPPQTPSILVSTMNRPQFQRPEPLGWGKVAFGTTIGVGAPASRKGEGSSSMGRTAWTQAYKSDVPPPAFPGRPYVVEIEVHPFRFRVYLTKDEADDLKVVLKYKPSWWVD
jgi:hypothetical protein